MILRALFAAALLALATAAHAQEHHHPAETITGSVAAFYETWYRPDRPGLSCCNRSDCYPTQARMRNGRWQALRREDGAWLTVPSSKIETGRDSPDGRSHLCAPVPQLQHMHQNGVICFIVGNGT